MSPYKESTINSHASNISSVDIDALREDCIFDPIDGTFVLKISDDDSSNTIDCSGGINDQGYRDSMALLITLAIVSLFLILLLYINGYSSK